MFRRIALIAVLATNVGCAPLPQRGATVCHAATLLPLDNDQQHYQDPTRALNLWSRCIETGPKEGTLAQAVALKMRSLAYAQLTQFDQAIGDLERSQRVMPPKTGWEIISLAALYRNAGQPERALMLLQKMFEEKIGLTGLGTSPGMPSYYHLGWTLSELQRWPEATEAFTEGLSYQADYGWAYLRRGLAYDMQGNHERAQQDVDRAIKELRIAAATSAQYTINIKATLISSPFKELLARYGYGLDALE